MTTRKGTGLFSALIDAIHGADEKIAGQAVTRLAAPLLEGDTSIQVTTTVGFGEWTDGAGDGRVAVGREVIDFSARTLNTFDSATRGIDNTIIRPVYPPGTVVYDLSRNTSGLDHVRRGFLVNFAIGTDLDVIGRNLGLRKCAGLTDDVWREVIKQVAYLAKQTPHAVITAMTAQLGAGNFQFYERLVSSPSRFFVTVTPDLADSIEGHFYLNSGEEAEVAVGGLVDVDYPIQAVPLVPGPGTLGVFGVYDDTPATRMGIREGFTNYFTGGSFAGSQITLGVDPGPGTPVLVDYNAFAAHYLPPDSAYVNENDVPPYLSDNLLGVRCLLNQVRAAGVGVELSAGI